MRDRPVEDVWSLYPVKHSTRKSKHMEYMNLAEIIAGLVLVMMQPARGSHSALSRTPATVIGVMAGRKEEGEKWRSPCKRSVQCPRMMKTRGVTMYQHWPHTAILHITLSEVKFLTGTLGAHVRIERLMLTSPTAMLPIT